MPSHLSGGRTYHPLEKFGSQANLQQFHNGFSLQDRPFHQSVIVMEFITED
jgi:hypothetical protein